MEFNDRLKQIRKKASLTQEDFALEIGINRGAYKNYENATSQPPFEVLKSISNRFGVDMNWLILGQNDNVNDNLNDNLNPDLLVNERYNVIVLEGVSALGNPAGIPSQFQVMADRTLWLPQLPAGNVYFAIKVAGDSMAPFYDDSDTIVITPLTQPAYYVPDRIYVVVMRDSTVFIKRLRPSMFGSTKGALELVSENSRYAPMYIDPTEVVCMYEIAARLTLTL